MRMARKNLRWRETMGTVGGGWKRMTEGGTVWLFDDEIGWPGVEHWIWLGC
jgi:hypothetical protein